MQARALLVQRPRARWLSVFDFAAHVPGATGPNQVLSWHKEYRDCGSPHLISQGNKGAALAAC
eukprot:2006137-Rhodomonas_salina.1